MHNFEIWKRWRLSSLMTRWLSRFESQMMGVILRTTISVGWWVSLLGDDCHGLWRADFYLGHFHPHCEVKFDLIHGTVLPLRCLVHYGWIRNRYVACDTNRDKVIFYGRILPIDIWCLVRNKNEVICHGWDFTNQNMVPSMNRKWGDMPWFYIISR